MKKTTRIICLVLCLVTLSGCFAGCASTDTTVGSQINMYLSSEVYNLDPAYAHVDASASKVLGLLYEGLYKLDDEGNVKAAACDNWIYTEDEGIDPEDTSDNIYKMVITLKDSAWSDGRALHADQFVYAWKRLLDPMFDGEGAELLYDIKGAWERKNDGGSPDDVGLIADKKILTILFKHSIDPYEFERKLASLALLPVRQDCVEYYHSWSTATTTMYTNGPYTLLSFYPGISLELVRNIYYNHNSEDEKKEPTPSKYVKPYKITVDFTLNAEDMMAKYENGELFYIGELPVSVRNQYKDKVKIWDTVNTHAYFFNTNIAPFNNAAVRKVLSGVIDRQAIVNEIVFAKPATGIIPDGIPDINKNETFASKNDTPILSTAEFSIEQAISQIEAAGIAKASFNNEVFEITVRVNTDASFDNDDNYKLNSIENSNQKIYDNVDYVVASKIVETWNKVAEPFGFSFKINCVNTQRYNEVTSSLVQFRDIYLETLYGTMQGGKWNDEGLRYTYTNSENETVAMSIKKERAGFDIIAVDTTVFDNTAFSALSVFASKYSGAKTDAEFNTLGHITGFNNEIYNNLISEADQSRIASVKYENGKKVTDQAELENMFNKLHEAEKLLLSEMPIIPIFVHQNAVLKSNKLKNVDYSYWGYPIFNKTKLPNWENYLPKSEDEETTEE